MVGSPGRTPTWIRRCCDGGVERTGAGGLVVAALAEVEMTGERHRIQVDDAYVAALGRAVFVFSVLELNAVYCCTA